MTKRYRIEGSIFYVTSVIYNRIKIFSRPSFITPILDSLNYYRFQYSCKLIGFAIMLDHIHLLLYPEKAESITEFMRDFKRFTSGRITRQAKIESITEWVEAFEGAGQKTERADYKVWQDSFWEQTIYTEKFLEQKLDYIHMNPVRAGIVKSAIEYPYSSCRNYFENNNQLIEMDSHWK